MKNERIKKYKKYFRRQFKEITKDPIKSLNFKPAIELAIKFFIPWIVGLSTLYILTILGYDFVSLVKISGMYIFNPAGSAMGVPYAVSLKINTYAALAYMLMLDAVASAFIIWNMDFLKLLPFFGKLVNRFMIYAQRAIDKDPKLKKVEFIGVMMFVLIPYPLTGSITGSFIGRLLGMDYLKAWIAVMIGATIRLVIYFSFLNGLQILL